MKKSQRRIGLIASMLAARPTPAMQLDALRCEKSWIEMPLAIRRVALLICRLNRDEAR